MDDLVQSAHSVDGISVVTKLVPGLDPNTLRDISDNVRQKLGDAVVFLGSQEGDRAFLAANVAPAAVERGVKAGELVRAVAPIVGGGGGGRDTLAQAGGKNPEKLPDALEAARAEIEKALG